MTRHLKLVAAVAVVLAALSGFTPNRSSSGGSSSHKSKSGGGCSSSRSHSYNGHRNTTSGGSSHNDSSTSGAEASGRIIDCPAKKSGAGEKQAASVVRVSNKDRSRSTYSVRVEFLDEAGVRVSEGQEWVTLGGGRSERVRVKMDAPSLVSRVESCRLLSVS